MKVLVCRCGVHKNISDYNYKRGQKYCSDACARRYRVYSTKPETLSHKVTVPLTHAQRAMLEQVAALEGTTITEVARSYIAKGLEDGQ